MITLDELKAAGDSGDKFRVREIATSLLGSMSAIELNRVAVRAEFDRLQGVVDHDALLLKHLADQDLKSKLALDFAICVPAIVDVAGPIETYLLPMLEALAGPYGVFLGYGLHFAIKFALAALQRWAAERVKHG